jgi:hypothetical protein
MIEELRLVRFLLANVAHGPAGDDLSVDFRAMNLIIDRD